MTIFSIEQTLFKKRCQLMMSCLLFAVTFSSYSAPENNKSLDPTKPLFGSKQASVVKIGNKLVLEGIFHSSHGGATHTAIINGKALKVNDTIGEYRLVAVNDDSVVLRSSEKRLRLSVFTTVINKSK